MAEKKSIKDIIIKVLFIIGIIFILLLLAFAVVRIIPRVFSSFATVGDIFTSPLKDKEITITSNSQDLSDQDAFQLNWNYSGNENGNFYLRYDCLDGIKLRILGENSKNLLCNTPYNLGQANTAQFQVAYTKENSFSDLPINISFSQNSNSETIATGSINLNVKNGDGNDNGNSTGDNNVDSEIINVGDNSKDNNTDNDNVGSNNNNSGGSTNNNPVIVSRPADLSILNMYQIGNTIRFDVYNLGGRSTGVWKYSYSLPNENTVTSPYQLSLNPGQGIRYTLTLDNNTNSGNVLVIVDSNSDVSELNESNNIRTINYSGNGNNNGGSTYYDDANLEVLDIEVGYISGNSFRRDDDLDEGDDAAIRVTVKNTGDESTGSWRFEVTDLPYDNGNDTYRSNRQNSLSPGQSITFTLEFENIDEGVYDIRFEADSDDDVDEERENDNTDTVRLRVRD